VAAAPRLRPYLRAPRLTQPGPLPLPPPDIPIRDSFKRQKEDVMREFDSRSSQVFLQLNEQGLNVALYWKNPDPRK
jgi:hypothetical protein